MDLDVLIPEATALATRIRHRLHQIPELAYEEFETAKLIRSELDALGIDHVAGVADAPTATLATIGDPAKPCIALRADIDALPITEQTGLPYASRRPGMMHACGHDGHAANLIAAASILVRSVAELNVCVKLIFQPAEEGGAASDGRRRFCLLCRANSCQLFHARCDSRWPEYLSFAAQRPVRFPRRRFRRRYSHVCFAGAEVVMRPDLADQRDASYLLRRSGRRCVSRFLP